MNGAYLLYQEQVSLPFQQVYFVFHQYPYLKLTNNIHKYILKGLEPNLIFVLKVSSNVSKKRLSLRKSKNRYDNFSKNFYEMVQKSFLKIAKNKKNYVILDSSKNDNLLEEKIFNIVSKKIKLI